MFFLFWLTLTLFILASIVLTVIILLQEPKQAGLGDGLTGGGQEFTTSGGVSGGLHRLTIIVGVVWGALALALQILPR